MHMCVYMYMYVYKYVYVYMCIHMFIFMYMSVYICTYRTRPLTTLRLTWWYWWLVHDILVVFHDQSGGISPANVGVSKCGTYHGKHCNLNHGKQYDEPWEPCSVPNFETKPVLQWSSMHICPSCGLTSTLPHCPMICKYRGISLKLNGDRSSNSIGMNIPTLA